MAFSLNFCFPTSVWFTKKSLISGYEEILCNVYQENHDDYLKSNKSGTYMQALLNEYEKHDICVRDGKTYFPSTFISVFSFNDIYLFDNKGYLHYIFNPNDDGQISVELMSHNELKFYLISVDNAIKKIKFLKTCDNENSAKKNTVKNMQLFGHVTNNITD